MLDAWCELEAVSEGWTPAAAALGRADKRTSRIRLTLLPLRVFTAADSSVPSQPSAISRERPMPREVGEEGVMNSYIAGPRSKPAGTSRYGAMWGLLWGLHIHLGTTEHITIRLSTTIKRAESKGVTGFSAILPTT